MEGGVIEREREGERKRGREEEEDGKKGWAIRRNPTDWRPRGVDSAGRSERRYTAYLSSYLLVSIESLPD